MGMGCCKQFSYVSQLIILKRIFCYMVMKVFGFTMLFMVLGTTFMLHTITTTTNSYTDITFEESGNMNIATVHNRKLKENAYNVKNAGNKKHDANMSLDDYRPVDPAPSSKAAITTGPIEHGTPLMPYIPKPAPPKSGGGDSSQGDSSP